jgi:hypothetical protein
MSREFAQTNGVKIKHWAKPARQLGEGGRRAGGRVRIHSMDGDKLVGAGVALHARGRHGVQGRSGNPSCRTRWRTAASRRSI